MGLLDAIDPLASAVGAVNTINSFRWVARGFNTGRGRHHLKRSGAPVTRQGAASDEGALVLGPARRPRLRWLPWVSSEVTTTTVAARRFEASSRLVLLRPPRCRRRAGDVVGYSRGCRRGAACDVISTLPADGSARGPLSPQGPSCSTSFHSPLDTLPGSLRARRGGRGRGTDMLVYQGAAQVS